MHACAQDGTAGGVFFSYCNNVTATNGTFSWKGVPFAKAPVGALRWKAPVDPDAWTSPLTNRNTVPNGFPRPFTPSPPYEAAPVPGSAP